MSIEWDSLILDCPIIIIIIIVILFVHNIQSLILMWINLHFMRTNSESECGHLIFVILRLVVYFV